MGKHVKGGGGMSHIRMFVIEATVPEGELAAVTTAIQNAFKPAAPAVRVPVKPASLPNGNGAAAVELEPEDIEGEFEETVAEAPAAPRAQRAPRKTKSAKVVDIDMHTSVSLAEFTKGKDPGNNHRRYLTIAAWLKEHRGLDAITPDHIYTCYKSMGWPSNIKDFAQPLRELKSAEDLFTQPDKGQYAINHVGLDKVRAFLA